MPGDKGTAFELARHLASPTPPVLEAVGRLRGLVTADAREAVATILLGELAQRIRHEAHHR